jgi:hypothetical protein
MRVLRVILLDPRLVLGQEVIVLDFVIVFFRAFSMRNMKGFFDIK